MLDYASEAGATREKYKVLFFVALFLLLGVVYYEVIQSNNKQTEIVFNTSPSNDEVIVDISGAVINPGVYTLPSEARLVDLMGASGGVSKDVSAEWVTKNLNLSQKLTDSQKFYIPFEWDIKESELGIQSFSIDVESTPLGLINLNSASLEKLKTLSGIGEIYAQRIIDARPLKSTEDLILNLVISESLLEKIKNDISF